MNKIIQIVLVAFIVSFPNNNSNAFISTQLKVGNYYLNLVFSKPAAKVGLIDEVARELLNLKISTKV